MEKIRWEDGNKETLLRSEAELRHSHRTFPLGRSHQPKAVNGGLHPRYSDILLYLHPMSLSIIFQLSKLCEVQYGEYVCYFKRKKQK